MAEKIKQNWQKQLKLRIEQVEIVLKCITAVMKSISTKLGTVNVAMESIVSTHVIYSPHHMKNSSNYNISQLNPKNNHK